MRVPDRTPRALYEAALYATVPALVLIGMQLYVDRRLSLPVVTFALIVFVISLVARFDLPATSRRAPLRRQLWIGLPLVLLRWVAILLTIGLLFRLASLIGIGSLGFSHHPVRGTWALVTPLALCAVEAIRLLIAAR